MTSLTIHYPPPGAEDIQSLTSSITTAQLLAAIADTDYDVIELGDGTYSSLTYPISINVDRTSRPLTIRPAAGATPRLYGATRPIYFGLSGYTAHITVQGLLVEGCDFSDAQDGIFWTGYVDHIAINDITIANLGPAWAANPRCWGLYASTDGVHQGQNITANGWVVDMHVNDARSMWSPVTVGHSPSPINVTLDDWVVSGGFYACYINEASENVTMTNWEIDDCGGADSTPLSVFWDDSSGYMDHVHATNCTGYPLVIWGSPQPTLGDDITGLG